MFRLFEMVQKNVLYKNSFSHFSRNFFSFMSSTFLEKILNYHLLFFDLKNGPITKNKEEKSFLLKFNLRMKPIIKKK